MVLSGLFLPDLGANGDAVIQMLRNSRNRLVNLFKDDLVLPLFFGAMFIGFFMASLILSFGFGRLGYGKTNHLVCTTMLDAYQLLANTPTGKKLAHRVSNRHILLSLAYLPNDHGEYHADSDQIVLNEGALHERHGSAQWLAGIMTHELTHAQQREMGVPDSLEAEMQAHVNQTLVWIELGAKNEDWSQGSAVYDVRFWIEKFLKGRDAFAQAVVEINPKKTWFGKNLGSLTPDQKKYLQDIDSLYSQVW